MMIEQVYEARKEAGASKEKAKAAAVALASFDNRLAYEGRFAKIESDLTLLKWMVGYLVAVTTTMAFKLFG